MLVLANLLALIHGLIVLPTIVLGSLVILLGRGRPVWLTPLFLVVGGVTGLSFLITGECFLTTWEQDLRQAAGAPSYTEGFVRHYLGRVGIDWPDVWTRNLGIVFLTLATLRLLWTRRRLAGVR